MVRMIVEYKKNSNRGLWLIGGILLVVAILIFGNFFSESKGIATSEQWAQVGKNMSEEEVVQELGWPKKKSKQATAIQASYSPALSKQDSDQAHSVAQLAMASGTHDVLGFMEVEAALKQGKDVTMFHYLIDGEDHYIYFLDGQSVIKY